MAIEQKKQAIFKKLNDNQIINLINYLTSQIKQIRTIIESYLNESPNANTLKKIHEETGKLSNFAEQLNIIDRKHQLSKNQNIKVMYTLATADSNIKLFLIHCKTTRIYNRKIVTLQNLIDDIDELISEIHENKLLKPSEKQSFTYALEQEKHQLLEYTKVSQQEENLDYRFFLSTPEHEEEAKCTPEEKASLITFKRLCDKAKKLKEEFCSYITSPESPSHDLLIEKIQESQNSFFLFLGEVVSTQMRNKKYLTSNFSFHNCYTYTETYHLIATSQLCRLQNNHREIQSYIKAIAQKISEIRGQNTIDGNNKDLLIADLRKEQKYLKESLRKVQQPTCKSKASHPEKELFFSFIFRDDASETTVNLDPSQPFPSISRSHERDVKEKNTDLNKLVKISTDDKLITQTKKIIVLFKLAFNLIVLKNYPQAISTLEMIAATFNERAKHFSEAPDKLQSWGLIQLQQMLGYCFEQTGSDKYDAALTHYEEAQKLLLTKESKQQLDIPTAQFKKIKDHFSKNIDRITAQASYKLHIKQATLPEVSQPKKSKKPKKPKFCKKKRGDSPASVTKSLQDNPAQIELKKQPASNSPALQKSSALKRPEESFPALQKNLSQTKPSNPKPLGSVPTKASYAQILTGISPTTKPLENPQKLIPPPQLEQPSIPGSEPPSSRTKTFSQPLEPVISIHEPLSKPQPEKQAEHPLSYPHILSDDQKSQYHKWPNEERRKFQYEITGVWDEVDEAWQSILDTERLLKCSASLENINQKLIDTYHLIQATLDTLIRFHKSLLLRPHGIANVEQVGFGYDEEKNRLFMSRDESSLAGATTYLKKMSNKFQATMLERGLKNYFKLIPEHVRLYRWPDRIPVDEHTPFLGRIGQRYSRRVQPTSVVQLINQHGLVFAPNQPLSQVPQYSSAPGIHV